MRYNVSKIVTKLVRSVKRDNYPKHPCGKHSWSHSVYTAGLAKSPKDPEEGEEGGSESREHVFRFSSLRRWWDLCDLQNHYYMYMSYKILMGFH